MVGGCGINTMLRRISVLISTRNTHVMARAVNEKYEEAVKVLNELQINSMVPLSIKRSQAGQDQMKQFLRRCDVSQDDITLLNPIHVTGTKGKGSTCAITESILRHSGIKTGFFSSPHLIEVRERIRINGRPISTDLFTKYFWEVYNTLDLTKAGCEVAFPSYFYFLTLLAFYVFKHEQITAAIIEVGIGGMYDCTNVMEKPAVCGVSSLGIDHVSILGGTLGEIAWQKSGIFKVNVPAFTVDQQPLEGLKVLHERAKEKGLELKISPKIQEFRNKDGEVIKLGLRGEYQKVNASLAVDLSKQWLENVKNIKVQTTPFYSDAFCRGLENVKWNGRAQVVKFNSLTFYLDGAHTMRSIHCATKWFMEESVNEELELNKKCDKVLVFNVTGSRDALGLLSILYPCGFKNAVFVPGIATLMKSGFNDQTNLKHPVEDRLATVITNHDEWLELCKTNNVSNPNTSMFPCIADVICWLAINKDKTLFKEAMLLSDRNVGDRNLGSNHLQVLVTGSLHLVGGFLRILKPDIND